MLININEKKEKAVIKRIKKGIPEQTTVEIETIGMYTGLQDSKGKEIYEGDILKTRHSNEPYGVVIWHPDGYYCVDPYFGIWPPKTDSMDALGKLLNMKNYMKDPQFEVIGNKIDNPELMGRKTVVLICKGEKCTDKKKCKRYIKYMDEKQKGTINDIFIIKEEECNNDRELYYIPIKKGGE